MPKKFKMNRDDINAFHKAVEGTKPLLNKKIRLSPPLFTHTAFKNDQPGEEELLSSRETLDIAPVKSEEFIVYKVASVPHKTLRKLRKGQYNVEAVLDLHGVSVLEAKKTVDLFLQQCLRENVQVALIIHGKGRRNQMPILKNKLNLWLRTISAVLAFCSATPTHGSRGALYVLLKRDTRR